MEGQREKGRRGWKKEEKNRKGERKTPSKCAQTSPDAALYMVLTIKYIGTSV